MCWCVLFLRWVFPVSQVVFNEIAMTGMSQTTDVNSIMAILFADLRRIWPVRNKLHELLTDLRNFSEQKGFCFDPDKTVDLFPVFK